MSLNVRGYNNKDKLLFPAAIGDYLPQDHLARVIDEVVDQLDLRCLYNKVSSVGNPSYHPKMMLKVLFYGYATSNFSSRKIKKELETDVAFIFLSGMQKPDFRTISDFRKNNLKELSEIFVQIVRLCRKLGLVELGHIALDSTVIKASANRDQFYEKEQLSDEEEKLNAKIKELLDAAEYTDAQEDKLYGVNACGDELPRELRYPQERLKKIQEAQRKLQVQSPKEINLTDADATFQMQRGGTVTPGYRAEVAIDKKEQVIVACEVINKRTDYEQLIPLVEQIEANLPETSNQKPIVITADSGYSSMDRLKELEAKKHIDAYIPDAIYQGKARDKKVSEDSPFHKKHFRYNPEKDTYTCQNNEELTFRYRRKEKGGQLASVYQCRSTICRKCRYFGVCTKSPEGRQLRCYDNADVLDRMRCKLDTAEGKMIYGRRKAIVEPALGNIKHNLGFRRFLLCGLKKVKIEFMLIAIAHNIKKMAKCLRKQPSFKLPRGDLIPLVAV
jgi:transposase